MAAPNLGNTGSCCRAGSYYCVCAGCATPTPDQVWQGDCGCECVKEGREPQPIGGGIGCCGVCDPPGAARDTPPDPYCSALSNGGGDDKGDRGGECECE